MWSAARWGSCPSPPPSRPSRMRKVRRRSPASPIGGEGGREALDRLEERRDHAGHRSDRRLTGAVRVEPRYPSDNWVPVTREGRGRTRSLQLEIDLANPNLGRYSATRRVARTIYLGSAPNREGGALWSGRPRHPAGERPTGGEPCRLRRCAPPPGAQVAGQTCSSTNL